MLSGLCLIDYEEVYVSPQASIVVLSARRHQPVIGDAGQSSPVLDAVDVIVAGCSLRPTGLHRQSVASIVGLGDHEPAQAFVPKESIERALLDLVTAVLTHRLQEQRAVDPDHQC